MGQRTCEYMCEQMNRSPVLNFEYGQCIYSQIPKPNQKNRAVLLFETMLVFNKSTKTHAWIIKCRHCVDNAVPVQMCLHASVNLCNLSNTWLVTHTHTHVCNVISLLTKTQTVENANDKGIVRKYVCIRSRAMSSCNVTDTLPVNNNMRRSFITRGWKLMANSRNPTSKQAIFETKRNIECLTIRFSHNATSNSHDKYYNSFTMLLKNNLHCESSSNCWNIIAGNITTINRIRNKRP